MKSRALYMQTLQDFDPAARLVAAADSLFMVFYAHMRRNARRIARLIIAFLPLMMLLVGSCKTSQTPGMSQFLGGMDQLRAALFPDRAIARDADYRPAAGYVSRARSFVEDDPAALQHLTAQDIGFIFGKPSMERKDADARIWQYKSGACVVDFYFYDQPGQAEAAVSYIDFQLKTDLIPGAAPRTEPVTLESQSGCLKKIAG